MKETRLDRLLEKTSNRSEPTARVWDFIRGLDANEFRTWLDTLDSIDTLLDGRDGNKLSDEEWAEITTQLPKACGEFCERMKATAGVPTLRQAEAGVQGDGVRSATTTD